MLKINEYCRRYWRADPSALRSDKRQLVGFILQYYIGFTPSQTAACLHVSRITIWRDYQSASLLFKSTRRFPEEVVKILSYVDYYSKYLPK